MQTAFRRRCTGTFGQEHLEFGFLRAVCTMGRHQLDRGIFARGLDGNCEFDAENERSREPGRTCILLRGLGGHLRGWARRR